MRSVPSLKVRSVPSFLPGRKADHLVVELGKKFGPFDLSFVPIWRGGTLGFVSWVGLRVRLGDLSSRLSLTSSRSYPTKVSPLLPMALQPTASRSTKPFNLATRSVRRHPLFARRRSC